MNTSQNTDIIEGVPEKYIDDALRITYQAFTDKFRFGFKDHNDFIRLLRESTDPTSGIAAITDGRLSGILSFQTSRQKPYRIDVPATFSKFSPWKAVLILFNMILLSDSAKPNEFLVASLAVESDSRGMGIGTALMRKAEEKANSESKSKMVLYAIGENEGAIRLYERLGYIKTKTYTGILPRIYVGSNEVIRMEKNLTNQPPYQESTT